MPLNDRQIRNAKPSNKPYKLNDGSGLYLYINTSGGKLWRFDYAFGGKRKTLSIGKYPAVSLVEAREAAENARRMMAQGQDPAAAKQTAKAAQKAALIRGAKWQEIDFDGRLWNIPPERMKMNRPHSIPLADWTLELLQELHALTGHTPYLFPSRTKAAGFISDATLTRIIERIGYKGIATPHGFRSLASSVLNEAGFNPDAVERQLAHIE